MLHHWVHQPFGDACKPGMGMGWWGTHFGRHQTWFEPGKAYMAYLGRSQAILQHGQAVAEYCALDAAPPQADPVTTAMLLKDLRVEGGRLVLSSGRSYPFLFLPSKLLRPAVARRIRQLVAEGATVVGTKPVGSPSLQNYPACDAEVQAMGEELWGPGQSTAPHPFGKGRAIADTPANVLRLLGIEPDATCVAGKSKFVRFAHRRDGDVDSYFVANLSVEPTAITAAFRVSGKVPELWRAEDGSRTLAGQWRKGERLTEVDLHLRAMESLFVIFQRPIATCDPVVAITRNGQPDLVAQVTLNDQGVPVLDTGSAGFYALKLASGAQKSLTVAPLPPAQSITGDWSVAFGPALDAPERMQFPTLSSWSVQENPAIRYFSGTATYRKEILVTDTMLSPSRRVVLDLGRVKNLASVTVNGTALGVVWHAPFDIDITSALRSGENQLEIAVTNTWANRLIGDEQEPADMAWGLETIFCNEYVGRPLREFPEWLRSGAQRPAVGRKCVVLWNYFRKTDKLLEAGLLGPVQLTFTARETVR